MKTSLFLFVLFHLLSVSCGKSREGNTGGRVLDADDIRISNLIGNQSEVVFGERQTLDDKEWTVDFFGRLMAIGQGKLVDGQVRLSVFPTWDDKTFTTLTMKNGVFVGSVVTLQYNTFSGRCFSGEKLDISKIVQESGLMDDVEIPNPTGLDGAYYCLEIYLGGKYKRFFLWCPQDERVKKVIRAIYAATDQKFDLDWIKEKEIKKP